MVAARPIEGKGSILRVTWEQSRDAAVHLEFSFDPDDWRTSPVRELPAGSNEELMLGVPYDAEVTWRLIAEVPGEGTTVTDDVTQFTDRIPTSVPVPWVQESDPTGWEPGMDYLLASVSYDEWFFGQYAILLVDRQGRVVWYHGSPVGFATMHPRISWDDDSFLFDYGAFWGGLLDGGQASQVVEMAIDGTELQRWDTPGLYHAFTDMPDGTLAYPRHWTLDRNDDPGPDGEFIILAHPDGSETELYNCTLSLFEHCGANTLSYDAEQDVFLYSLFTLDSVLEIDASTGEVNKQFGHLEGSWAFDPPESAFWYQHGSVYTDDGHLLVSTHHSQHDTELVVREYEVDEGSRTLRQVWSFGEGAGVVGRQMGEAHRLRGGNTLHNHGTHAVVREITADGRVVWDLRWETMEYNAPSGHTVGRSVGVYGDLYRFIEGR